jgi:hypothetical protein
LTLTPPPACVYLVPLVLLLFLGSGT